MTRKSKTSPELKTGSVEEVRLPARCLMMRGIQVATPQWVSILATRKPNESLRLSVG